MEITHYANNKVKYFFVLFKKTCRKIFIQLSGTRKGCLVLRPRGIAASASIASLFIHGQFNYTVQKYTGFLHCFVFEPFDIFFNMMTVFSSLCARWICKKNNSDQHVPLKSHETLLLRKLSGNNTGNGVLEGLRLYLNCR